MERPLRLRGRVKVIVPPSFTTNLSLIRERCRVCRARREQRWEKPDRQQAGRVGYKPARLKAGSYERPTPI
jgi:hypothetical protein